MAHTALILLPVLRKLGLITDGCWADHAEPVLSAPAVAFWTLDLSNEPHFVNLTREAVNTRPTDIRNQIKGLVAISDKDTETSIA